MSRELTIKTAAIGAKRSGTIAIYASAGSAPEGAGGEVWSETGLDWDKVSSASRFEGKRGQVLDIAAPANLEAERLLVLGAGKPTKDGEFVPTAWSDRGGSLAGKLMALRVDEVSVLLDGDDITPETLGEIAAGIKLRHYRFDKYRKLRADDEHAAEPEKLTLTLHVEDKAAADGAIADRMATAEGTILARDLVNEPPNELGPLEFTEIAKGLSDYGVEIEILTPEQMEELGMRALLAVGQGSTRPSRLVIMQWHGGKKDEQPVAFVGKGVVFDTGGISIKPAANMENMKGDMGGAAAVTGLMKALAMRKAKVNAIGVIGLVENMPDGNAMRPGDIIKAMSGTTIEVLNTDAEGRLVLSDALWYTQDRFKPKFMINLATLTGAILVALAGEHAGLFSNDDELSEKLLASGLTSGEKLWRLPLGPAYDKMIESQFADIKNTGGRYGGSITAAQFLQRFVNDVPWAHLDIAGTAFGASKSETNTSWAPGFGVALLDRLVRDYYEA